MQGMQPCSGTLQEIVARGRPCYKARLLHYFTNPSCSKQAPGMQPAWCGWHTDHSSLTGVCDPSLHVPYAQQDCYSLSGEVTGVTCASSCTTPPALPCPALLCPEQPGAGCLLVWLQSVMLRDAGDASCSASICPAGRHCALHLPLNWCALTLVAANAGLASAMYMRGGEQVPNPDSASGLYIRDQRGRAVQVWVHPDHIAFQMGEAMQAGTCTQ